MQLFDTDATFFFSFFFDHENLKKTGSKPDQESLHFYAFEWKLTALLEIIQWQFPVIHDLEIFPSIDVNISVPKFINRSEDRSIAKLDFEN